MPDTAPIFPRVMLPPETVRLDDLELDLARYELRPGDRVIKLEKNPMELLILLVENPGGLVTRDQIIGRLWSEDVFVDRRHGVNTAIHKLRNAIGDDSEQPRILETVVGKRLSSANKVGSDDQARYFSSCRQRQPLA